MNADKVVCPRKSSFVLGSISKSIGIDLFIFQILLLWASSISIKSPLVPPSIGVQGISWPSMISFIGMTKWDSSKDVFTAHSAMIDPPGLRLSSSLALALPKSGSVQESNIWADVSCPMNGFEFGRFGSDQPNLNPSMGILVWQISTSVEWHCLFVDQQLSANWLYSDNGRVLLSEYNGTAESIPPSTWLVWKGKSVCYF